MRPMTNHQSSISPSPGDDELPAEVTVEISSTPCPFVSLCRYRGVFVQALGEPPLAALTLRHFANDSALHPNESFAIAIASSTVGEPRTPRLDRKSVLLLLGRVPNALCTSDPQATNTRVLPRDKGESCEHVG
jgi:hypothetical protein